MSDSTCRKVAMKTMKRVMRWTANISVLAVFSSALAFSQDTHYAPTRQQIPPPGCFTLRGAWEGGYTPCTATSHQEWLADVTHWRTERGSESGSIHRATSFRHCYGRSRAS